MDFNIEIAQDCQKWLLWPLVNRAYITKVLKLTIMELNWLQNLRKVAVSVLLTNTSRMEELSCQFLGKKVATNVISFPEAMLGCGEACARLNNVTLGDIAFCCEIIENEAIQQGKSFIDHFTHLLTHSILHLLGYTHCTQEGASAMENLETKILKNLLISNPYII